MATLDTITVRQRAECVGFAVQMAQAALGEGAGYVSPNARIGTLSSWEWEKVAMGAVSGWVAERSRQVGERFLDEQYLLATGELPEPYELGLTALVLPGLGELVEGMGLTDRAIGAWSRDEICTFVWTCAQMLNEARARNDERPEPAADQPELLMAG